MQCSKLLVPEDMRLEKAREHSLRMLKVHCLFGLDGHRLKGSRGKLLNLLITVARETKQSKGGRERERQETPHAHTHTKLVVHKSISVSNCFLKTDFCKSIESHGKVCKAASVGLVRNLRALHVDDTLRNLIRPRQWDLRQQTAAALWALGLRRETEK